MIDRGAVVVLVDNLFVSDSRVRMQAASLAGHGGNVYPVCSDRKPRTIATWKIENVAGLVEAVDVDDQNRVHVDLIEERSSRHGC